jgi:hypothetical protein
MIWSIYAIGVIEAVVQDVAVNEVEVLRGDILVLLSKLVPRYRLICVARLHALSLFLPLARRFREAFFVRHQRLETLTSICL